MNHYMTTIINKVLVLCAVSLLTVSCGNDFLTNQPTERQAAGAPATEGAIFSNITSCYQILLFDSYANNQYNSVPLISDLRSDDIYKGGGDAGDQHQLYLLSQFESTPTETLGGLWSIYFTGLARSNNAIIACENAVDLSKDKQERYMAEARTLRAYFVHWLWKFWGNIPYFTQPLSTPPYMTKQLSADEIYALIMADLKYATGKDQNGRYRLPMSTRGNELGRINLATAMMLKARVVLYQKDVAEYPEITKDMAQIIASNDYKLVSDYASIWVDAGEFNEESIFEVNHIPEGKTWASGWQGYGTNLPAFISPNGLNAGNNTGDFKGGWGFGPVREKTWAIFEEGDTRREGSINHFASDLYTQRFQDTGYFMAKYAARVGYNPSGDVDLNFANNFRVFRYAETLLNYAELVTLHGQSEVNGISAQDCLDQIRARAFGENRSIPLNPSNVKLERRREFVGEGMRYWDLVRWGDTGLLTDNDAFSTRTWTANDKYLPIPQSEIDNTKGTEFELQQNPGY